MESFTYTNIFETKGIEYIVVIIFLGLLVPFWFILNRKIQVSTQIKKALGFLSANILKIPRGVYHSKNHTWAYLNQDGEAKVGLDDLLLHITGEVKFSNLKSSGENVNRGDLLFEMEQNKKVLQVFSPISGEVVDANEVISSNPEMVNEDPYGKGWICKIKPTDWKNETASYYLAEEAIKWAKEELDRFKDFLAESAKKYTPDQSMLILQDGGEIRDNTLTELPEEIWDDFQKEFLNANY